MELRQEYKDELADLEQKMLDAQAFAEQFPAFAKNILENKFGKDFTGTITSSYKRLYFGWGVKRWFYKDKENITNYRGDFSPQYLWEIYINEYSLFGDGYVDAGLDGIKDGVDLFFYDRLNSTFYATDNQLMPLLDALAAWYEKAAAINAEWKKEQKKKDLLAQLEKLA